MTTRSLESKRSIIESIPSLSSESVVELAAWRRLAFKWGRAYGGGIIAGIILIVIVLSVLFAEYLTPHDPTGAMNLTLRFKPPFWQEGGSIVHPFGTDNLGRDILSRTLYGGRASLHVAFFASTVATLFGMCYGIISGYVGGLVDRILMRIADTWISFPFLVLALAVIASVGSSTHVLIVLLSLAAWVHPAKLTRAHTLQIREREFVHAAYALGATPLHIITRHVVPNVLSINIVMWTFSVSTLVLIESSLSFIGMGISPPTPSWGNMLQEGNTYLQDAWWMSVVPGLGLMLTILCVNTVGDALQKASSRGTLNE